MGFPRRPSYCRACGHLFPWEENIQQRISDADIWSFLHQSVCEVSKARFEKGYYADAVEAASKELISRVKNIYRDRRNKELDGVNLMHKTFTPDNPVLILGDLDTESGQSIQQGYMKIFAGAIAAVCNPTSHENITITAERAVHHLFLSSLLFYKLDEAFYCKADNEE